MADGDPGDEIRCEREGGVATITIDRPHRANALTPDNRNRLIDLLADAGTDLHVRAVLLRAEGKHFCTGADLGVDHDDPDRPDDAPARPVGHVRRLLQDGSQRLIGAVLDCDKPVVVAVNGAAAGIGAHLALAGDLVVAADDARFIEVFVRRGIAADGGGAYLLPRLIGVRRTMELMLLGDDLPAATASQWGLVNRVVPPADLVPTATALAGRLATGPTVALTAMKHQVNRSLDGDRGAALLLEAMGQEAVMQSTDATEGVAAFLERRDPTYRGW